MKETKVSPSSRKAIQYRGVECLNCGHPLDLTDRFCAYCGQLNTTKRLAFSDFFSEFFYSIFTYDSKFRYTIKDLLFKPGTITRYYVEGKRLMYANPFRFFLSISIIYFLLLGAKQTYNEFTGKDTENTINNFDFDKDANVSVGGVEEFTTVMDSLEKAGDFKDIPKPVFDKINAGIKESTDEAIAELEKKQQTPDSLKTGYDYFTEESIADQNYVNRNFKKFELFRDFYLSTDIENAQVALDSLKFAKSNTNIWLYSKNEVADRINKNRTKFIFFIVSKIPFFLFFFAPFFAFFLWLIYSKKRFNYMEHLVFIFHIFSWVFLVLTIMFIPDMLIGSGTFSSIILFVIGPFYFYKALRNFYKQGRFKTILKFVFLNTVFFIACTLAASLFVIASAAFY